MPALALLRRTALPFLAALWPLAAAHAARPALPPLDGQVIVKFKAGGDTMRAHALAARADAATARGTLAGRAAALGARVGRTLEAGEAVGERTQVVRVRGADAAALAAQLAKDPDVEFAVADVKMRRTAAPNDPFYLRGPAVTSTGGVSSGGPDSGQWYLRAPTATVLSSIDIEAAWTRTSGRSDIVVAILDTGVRKEHPELAGRLLAGYDFVSDAQVANDGDQRDADPTDPGDYTTASENSDRNGTFYQCDPSGRGLAVVTPSSWHGTSTASLAGAATNDGVGMAGVAPGVKILPVRVLGKCFGNASDIMAAMRWSAGISVPGVPDNPNPAKVINLSLGGGSCSTISQSLGVAYQDVVNEVIAKGVTIVAAAGNSDGEPMEAPGACTGVVSVVALRHLGTKVGFSSLGSSTSPATIAAPGGNCVNLTGACLYPILAARNTGTQGPIASGYSDSFETTLGTSFSSPLVAGVVGLMYSAQPNITPAQVSARLTSTARAFPTTGAGSGVAQCHAPNVNVVQDECYCVAPYCGAGMLDAGAAVAAVSALPPVARISFTPASPVAGGAVTLSASTSTPSGTSTITGYGWVLTDGGGLVSGTANGANISTGVTATVTPAAGGSFTVTLTVTDNTGATGQVSQVVTVAGTSTGGSGGGGGGAMSAPWLALLAAATLLLFRRARRRA